MNNFCKQNFIKEDITLGDTVKEVTFYEIPYGTILRMKTAGKALASLVATLMTDTSKDVSVETTTAVSEERDAAGEAYVNTNTVQKEISPSLASFRHKQIMDSANGLLDTVLSPETSDLIAEIIVMSASDEFTKDDAKDISTHMGASTLIQFLTCSLKASAGGLQGLGKLLSPQAQGKLGKVVGAVKEKLPQKDQ